MYRYLVLASLAMLLGGAAGAEEPTRGNAILVVKPYRHAGTWVFDDETVGLTKEPFISGVPEILDKMVADIPNAETGFRLLFSGRDFPGATHKFLLRRPEKGGHWYYSPDYEMEGWLCPALLKYFKQAPSVLYAKTEAIETE